MQLSQRKHEILCSAIEDYIKDATVITSGGVQKKQTIKLSTATLRNELNALEEMGFLKQVYTSGGRVPTVEGYKYYVENLVKNLTVDKSHLDVVKELLAVRTKSLSDIASEIAKIISKATKYPTAILMDGYDKLMVESVSVIPLLEKQAMALIQTNSGYLNNTIKVEASKKACEDASKYLSNLFNGKTIGFLVENIDEIEKEIAKQIAGFEQIVDSVVETLKQMSKTKYLDVRHDGTKQFVERTDAKDMQKVLSLLSDEEKLSSTLRTVENEGQLFVQIDENDEELAGLALVKAPIIVDGTQVASIGVVGPQRMDYATITAVLKLIVDEIKGGENVK